MRLWASRGVKDLSGGKPVWASQDCEKIGDAASYETTENSARYLSLLLDAWCLGWETPGRESQRLHSASAPQTSPSHSMMLVRTVPIVLSAVPVRCGNSELLVIKPLAAQSKACMLFMESLYGAWCKCFCLSTSAIPAFQIYPQILGSGQNVNLVLRSNAVYCKSVLQLLHNSFKIFWHVIACFNTPVNLIFSSDWPDLFLSKHSV